MAEFIVPKEKGETAMKQIPIERREEAIPEGYVKVVRCKDCKHYANGICWNSRTVVFDMDYCSRGERKEETE